MEELKSVLKMQNKGIDDGYLGYFQFMVIINNIPWPFMYKFLCREILSYLLSKNLEMEFWGGIIGVLTF